MLDTRERELQYGGHVAVCITVETSITMIYDLRNNMLKFSFSIQRYSAAGFVVDTTVQAKVNLPKMDSTEYINHSLIICSQGLILYSNNTR